MTALEQLILDLKSDMLLRSQQREISQLALDLQELAQALGFAVQVDLMQARASPSVTLTITIDMARADAAQPQSATGEMLGRGLTQPMVSPPDQDDAAPDNADQGDPFAVDLGPVELVEPEDVPAPATADRSGLPWTEEEDQRAIELKAAGLTHAQVAEALNRPVPAVGFRIKTVLRDRIAAARDIGVIEQGAVHVAVNPAAEHLHWRAPDDSTLRYLADADALTAQDMRLHLLWLYGGKPEADALARDLELVELLVRGEGAAGAAAKLDCAKDQIIDRFQELRGGLPVTVRLQEKLLMALRDLRAALERGA